MSKKYIQVQMLYSTLEKVESLKKIFNSSTKSDTVKTSIDIAFMVANVLASKGEVILKEKDGTNKKLILPGLSRLKLNPY